MFNPSREDARRFFLDAWRKHRERLPLQPQEEIVTEIILQHPEYHAVLEDQEGSLTREWSEVLGETNPFLHLALHLAITEQVSIDQPAGMRERYRSLLMRLGDEHQTQHRLMHCLVEALWHMQRHSHPFDTAEYLRCIDRASRR